MEKDNIHMVCVRCFTFNQAQYIEDALNGFCMQQTSFPFVCVIVDDASTDGEPGVISNYFRQHFNLDDSAIVRREETDDYNMVYAQHCKNRNCYFAVYYLKYNHYSIKKSKDPYLEEWAEKVDYFALCEGDDYWIDPLKLQKQVDFLEVHPEHSLCFCACRAQLPNGEQKVVKRYESNVDSCSMDDIILGGGGFMATNSMVYRKNKYVPYSTWAVGCPIGDAPLMLTLAHRGNVGYLSEVMGVYRVSAEGSWTQRMSADRKMRNRHYRAIITMWKQFDVWSGGKYHNIIKKKIIMNRNEHLKDLAKSLIHFYRK